MRRVKAILVSIVLVTGLSLAPGLAQPSTKHLQQRSPLPPGVKALKDLEYGKCSGRAMRLDLYLPEKGDKPLPLIIWIHGGAWMAGSKDDPSPALRFTANGYAVAQVGYPVTTLELEPGWTVLSTLSRVVPRKLADQDGHIPQ